MSLTWRLMTNLTPVRNEFFFSWRQCYRFYNFPMRNREMPLIFRFVGDIQKISLELLSQSIAGSFKGCLCDFGVAGSDSGP